LFVKKKGPELQGQGVAFLCQRGDCEEHTKDYHYAERSDTHGLYRH